MAITIRPAQASDATRWEEIHAAGWEYAYRGIFEDEFLDGAKEHFIKNTHKTAEFLSGKDGIKLVAVDEASMVIGIMFGLINSEKKFELQGLYVDPKHIGGGIGKKLVQEFADWVKKNNGQQFVIGCLEANKSCGFYKKLGGTEIQRRMFREKYPEIVFQFILNNNDIKK